MHASDHGAVFGVLQGACCCARLSVLIPLCHDCLQLLLFYMPWPHPKFQGEEQVGRHASSRESIWPHKQIRGAPDESEPFFLSAEVLSAC